MTHALRAAALAALAPLAACGGGAPPSAAPRPETLMQPGISRELARQRAAGISAVRYDLWLDLTQRDSAAGTVAIAFTRAARGGDLVADFRGQRLTELRANGDPVRDFEWRNGHVRIPEHHLRTGENRVEARFTTRIAPAGAAIIRFDDRSDNSTYLYTLLVPSDANLLFPCFDQPDLKARFRWRLSAPRGWRVLANARAESADTAQGGVTWSFAQTEPISTYLAAFAAGPWHAWESAPAGGRPITLFARASRAREVDADTLTRTNREAAAWLEGWFGIPFPFSKLDNLLAPAFPFGGMEHVGEIFYNENSFIFREPPTLTQKLGRDATIFHEVAHQWFGDLVTMRWFDDLWLKEGFATYMAARMQEELRPGSEAWKTFYLRNKPLAYGVDVTRGTTPVWQELANLDLAKSNYGPIVYNKAPSVIKQLSFLVGDSAFRAGLHGFLTAHRYGNATWQELLASVEQASGTPLRRFGEQYILRAGMPRVDTHLETEGGAIRSLVLTQRIARPLEGDPGGWWPMKVNVRLGYHGREDVVLPATFAGDSVHVQGAAGLPVPDYVWPNDGDYGYGLFFPDERSAAWIADHVGDVRQGLLRAMLWGALWDLVRDTKLSPARFAEIAMRELPREQDEQIASLILDRGATALTRYANAADAARLYPAWERMLAERARDARLGYGMRKESLDMLVATARTPEARPILREYLSGTRWFDGAAVKQPTRWSIVQRLLALGEPDARAIFDAEVRRDSTPEAARRAFVAAVAAPDTAVKAAYFRRYLDDPTLNEEWVTASLGAFNDPDQARLTLPFLRPSLERLEWIRDNRRIFFLPSWINAFIRSQSSPEALATVDQLLAAHPELPIDIRRKVLQARDELERTVEIRRAAGAE
ncbi:MAG TPA: M1 family aminopeptidase [Longimicrobium sp.]|nr:M1 family aminopeptidase [Longimicrobium sp.]